MASNDLRLKTGVKITALLKPSDPMWFANQISSFSNFPVMTSEIMRNCPPPPEPPDPPDPVPLHQSTPIAPPHKSTLIALPSQPLDQVSPLPHMPSSTRFSSFSSFAETYSEASSLPWRRESFISDHKSHHLVTMYYPLMGLAHITFGGPNNMFGSDPSSKSHHQAMSDMSHLPCLVFAVCYDRNVKFLLRHGETIRRFLLSRGEISQSPLRLMVFNQTSSISGMKRPLSSFFS